MSSKPRFARLPLVRGKRSRCRSAKLKGKMQNIIVVKPPNPMFRQAVFFLRDDYFLSSDISRTELLRQAEDAAAGFVEKQVPEVKGGKTAVILISVFALSAAAYLVFYFLL